jgi:ureidoglycolate amidohydrolase
MATSSASSLSDRISVQPEAIARQIEELGDLSDTTPPAITRIIYSENDVRARDYVKGLMAKAGLTVREDAIGNIYGRLDGEDASLAPVLSGSHTDAIPLSGKYDGVLGVLGAVEALKAIKDSGVKLRRSVEALMFTSEEPTRFGLSCIGSRAMCGRLEESTLDSLTDSNGTSFLDACHSADYGKDLSTAEILKASFVRKGDIHAFVELHIEQGPLLEADELDIGVVTAIAAPASLSIDLQGNGGHAGALLMPYRKDAGLAASEIALAVEASALDTGLIDTVATTGVMKISPGAVNSVPRQAHVGIDVRDIDEERRDAVLNRIIREAEAISNRRDVGMTYKVLNQDPPAPCADHVVDAVQSSANELGFSSMKMVSRAYHDALFMAQIAPTGMIFIPCRDGVSHRPDEYSSPKDMVNGIKTLALTMAKLAEPIGIDEEAGSDSHNEL